MKASELLVACLENEGVEFLFAAPCSCRTRMTRMRAFMADVYGRLTGKAGVCLATLGPGATNLLTGVADANLDRVPLVAITGQASLDRTHKESHQYIDVMALFTPVTKWQAQIARASIIPEAVRKAFKVAQTEKPGATHRERPEDIAASQVDERADETPLRVQAPFVPEPLSAQRKRASQAIRAARRPLNLAGIGVVRHGAHEAEHPLATAMEL